MSQEELKVVAHEVVVDPEPDEPEPDAPEPDEAEPDEAEPDEADEPELGEEAEPEVFEEPDEPELDEPAFVLPAAGGTVTPGPAETVEEVLEETVGDVTLASVEVVVLPLDTWADGELEPHAAARRAIAATPAPAIQRRRRPAVRPASGREAWSMLK